ncbi:MAG: hypothetical protein R2784_18775 [Saprospiraceae bacterium]
MDNSFQENPIRFELIDLNGKKLIEKSFNSKSDQVFSIEDLSRHLSMGSLFRYKKIFIWKDRINELTQIKEKSAPTGL